MLNGKGVTFRPVREAGGARGARRLEQRVFVPLGGVSESAFHGDFAEHGLWQRDTMLMSPQVLIKAPSGGVARLLTPRLDTRRCAALPTFRRRQGGCGNQPTPAPFTRSGHHGRCVAI